MEIIGRINTGSAEDVKRAISDIEKVDEVLHVLDEKVAPYGYYIPMREMIDSARDYEKCTYYSKLVIIEELNGCIAIINEKIALSEEPDVEVRFLVGKNQGEIKSYKESIAIEFVEMGMAELVQR